MNKFICILIIIDKLKVIYNVTFSANIKYEGKVMSIRLVK